MAVATESGATANRSSQTASPSTGQTVTIAETPKDVDLWMSPAGLIASATVALPTTGAIGQIVTIGSSQVVTTLSITGAASILNPLNTLNSGDSFQMKKVNATTWTRLL